MPNDARYWFLGLLTLLAVGNVIAGDAALKTSPPTVAPTDPIERAAMAASISPYSRAVAKLFGISLSVQEMLAACNESSPETRQANDAAYRVWRNAHRETLDLIERHADVRILENSAGNANIANQVKQRYRTLARESVELEYGNNLDLLKATCAAFPREIQRPVFDMEHFHAKEVSLLQSHLLPQ